MHRKLLIALAVAALIPFAFAACGGDGDEETTDAATTEETTTETGGGSGGGGGGASTVEFTADPSGALEFEQDSVEAASGEVTLDLTNESSLPHDVQVEGPEGDIGGTETVTGGSTSTTVELEPGDYTFYCSVPGHREAGMEGTLTVN